MCQYESLKWRCDVDHGFAVISELTGFNCYKAPVYVIRARIPLDEAVTIAKQLMAHRKRPREFAPEADAMEAG